MFRFSGGGFNWINRKTGDKRLSVLIFLIILIGSIGFSISIAVFFLGGLSDGLFKEDFCFKKDCIKHAKDTFDYSLYIIFGTINLLVAMATVGGIFVALLSYLHSTSATAFGNHISHLVVFHSYLASEISKNHRISPSSLDVFYWYNLIFPDARSGMLMVSTTYEVLIKNVRDEIVSSNNSASNAKSGSFRYVDHQNRMVVALSGLGIRVDRQPRVDFFEVEKQILSLIKSVNFAFCRQSSRCDLPKSIYF